MTRAPGLSVRLKLTLSYAAFLMLAGALLLGVVWLFLLRYVPDGVIVTPGPTLPTRSTSWVRSQRRVRRRPCPTGGATSTARSRSCT